MKIRPRNKLPILAWLAFLLFLSFSSLAQRQATDKVQVIPQSVSAKLQRDAARLALRMLNDSKSLEHQHIVIPGYKIDELYKVLASIYEESPTARALEKCDVHTFPDPSIDRMVVVFKKSAPWAQSIKKGSQTTSQQQLNVLLSKYQLNIEKSVNWDDAHDALILRAGEPLNMAALGVVFLKIQGVVKVETGVPETTGNDITARPVNGGWEVTYILRFGGHISGKGKMHTWKFRVIEGSAVKLLKESGDKLPRWMDCAKVEKN